MSEWINVNLSKPPVSHSVLLYVAMLDEHNGKKYISDHMIITGFYGDKDWEKKGFYEESYESIYKYIEERSDMKVIAWTLLPSRPSKEFLEHMLSYNI
jgi:hypothetical protein